MTLYIVATPIGNLSDLTERARQVFTTVPTVLAEDTRRTAVLLRYVGATPRVWPYHRHTSSAKIDSLLNQLEQGDVALVSDAGTPGVNDPGGQLVAAAVRRYGSSLKVVPVPGASAIMAAASVSGFPMDVFTALGFPPHKKGRQTFFNEVAAKPEAMIFYESPYRVQSAVDELAKRCPERLAVICRELTKHFETTYRGATATLSHKLKQEKPRGDYVVVLAPLSFSS